MLYPEEEGGGAVLCISHGKCVISLGQYLGQPSYIAKAKECQFVALSRDNTLVAHNVAPDRFKPNF